MSKELAIVKRESVDMIVSAAPTAYADNQVSHQRCLQAVLPFNTPFSSAR